MNFDEFGQRLQSLRKKKEMTQSEFADRLGVTGQAVSKWENNQSYPDITLLPTIATILDVEVNFLFGIKKKNIKSTFDFPKNYEGMNIIHSYQNVACYSTKTVLSIHDSGIKFKDGSTVELSNHLVVNMGTGEIQLLVLDNIENNLDLSSTIKKFEFDYIENLDLEIYACKCELVYSKDNKCRVIAKGETPFINFLDVRIQNDKLIIRFDNKDEYKNSSQDKNNITIELPCEIGKSILTKINGNGILKSDIKKFENGKFFINGSGIMNMLDFNSCNISINGSGSIKALNTEECDFSINGSGHIEWNSINDLNVSINGSGNVDIKNSKTANVNISGSGYTSINKLIGGGDSILRISGSGNIDINGGNCDKFDVVINGSGNINADNVTTRKASIIIEINGKVVLGRVTESSIEQIKKKGNIIILNRGKE